MKREAANLFILVGGNKLWIASKVVTEGEMTVDVQRTDAVAV